MREYDSGSHEVNEKMATKNQINLLRWNDRDYWNDLSVEVQHTISVLQTASVASPGWIQY